MNALRSELNNMSVAEKLELLEALWDSIAASPDELPVPDWQKGELATRKAALAANPDTAVPWDEAKKQILRGRG